MSSDNYLHAHLIEILRWLEIIFPKMVKLINAHFCAYIIENQSQGICKAMPVTSAFYIACILVSY